MPYTDEQKAEAVRLYQEAGPDEAARIVGCSRRAVYVWLGMHGVQTKTPDETRAETEARHAAKRTALREALIDTAIAAATAINPEDPKGSQALAVTVGILLDKYRLEMGETTGRTEVLAPIDLELQRIVDEHARQS